MHSGLLNIWRENGNYLRYGDAKNLVSMGVTGAIFNGYYRTKIGLDRIDWSVFGYLNLISTSVFVCAATILFALSLLASAAAVLPALSRRNLRVDFAIWVGKKMRIISNIDSTPGVVYFIDIAMHTDAEEYGQSIVTETGIAQQFSGADKQLIGQIWIVSKIATAKYVYFYISVFLTITAIAISVL